MINLEKEELNEVKGGFVKSVGAGFIVGIGTAVTFLIGALSGYVRPYPCSSTK